jgi:hypothetical protein
MDSISDYMETSNSWTVYKYFLNTLSFKQSHRKQPWGLGLMQLVHMIILHQKAHGCPEKHHKETTACWCEVCHHPVEIRLHSPTYTSL